MPTYWRASVCVKECTKMPEQMYKILKYFLFSVMWSLHLISLYHCFKEQNVGKRLHEICSWLTQSEVLISNRYSSQFFLHQHVFGLDSLWTDMLMMGLLDKQDVLQAHYIAKTNTRQVMVLHRAPSGPSAFIHLKSYWKYWNLSKLLRLKTPFQSATTSALKHLVHNTVVITVYMKQ